MTDVRLAQLDRAFGYGPKGRGFESSSARAESPVKSRVSEKKALHDGVLFSCLTRALYVVLAIFLLKNFSEFAMIILAP